MAKSKSLTHLIGAAAFCLAICSWESTRAEETRVLFDLPDAIECRDMTPRDFALAHPTLKVIEAKFRISARIVSGSESEIADFLYIITSPGHRMRFQDYLPNTTLESTVADDNIEITDTTEKSLTGESDAHVGYKVLSLGISNSKTTKKTESAHSKQIATRALVVASGTTDREHGLFFKLRPSKTASLEGAKDFKFLAIVPRSWRGDWCTISCAAGVRSKGFLAKNSVRSAGVEQAQVGLYLAGNAEAANLVNELRRVQAAHEAVLARQLNKNGDGLLDTMYAGIRTGYCATLCGVFKTFSNESQSGDPHRKVDPDREKLEAIHQAVLDVQERLGRLAE